MSKASNKTVETDVSVDAFLSSVDNEARVADTRVVMDMMARITGHPPKMWGPSMIGFDQYHYKYDSGREGDYFRTGVSPRKTALTIYIMPGYQDYGEILSRLGKHKMGKSCLYINKLADIDLDVLDELIREGLKDLARIYPYG